MKSSYNHRKEKSNMIRFDTAKKMRVLALPLLIAASFLLQSCAYLQHRGDDAKDILDIGITVTPSVKPDFALYFDFFNMLPLGYSNVDGKLLGIGYRQGGALDYQSHNWGVWAYGSEKQGAGVFNPNDPRHARQGVEPAEPWPAYDAGFVRVFAEDNPPPKFHYMECTRQIHLGWIGYMMDFRPVDLLDFFVGWTTIDILHDDHIPRPKQLPGSEKGVMTIPDRGGIK
jgi:hypothetical protein